MLGTMLQSAYDRLAERASRMLTEAGDAALALLLALAVLFAGVLVARALGWLTDRVLHWTRFDSGVRRALGPGAAALPGAPASLAAGVVRWGVIAFATALAADALGLDLVHTVGERLAEVLPRVVAAAIELGVGIAAAMACGAVTRRVSAGAGPRAARLRGQAVAVAAIAFAVLVSLEQLGLAAEFVTALGITVIAALGVAAALAFGLGCRDLARDFVVEYLRSLDTDAPPPPRG